VSTVAALEIFPVDGLPDVGRRTRLGAAIAEQADLRGDDVVVVAADAVARSEGRTAVLEGTAPRQALIGSESVRVLRHDADLVVTETAHGFVCVDAGITWPGPGGTEAILLPDDPDRAAHKVRNAVRALTGLRVGVVVSTTFDRAWRHGRTAVAIGAAGVTSVAEDGAAGSGRATICIIDELAAAAHLAMVATATWAAVVRGAGTRWLDDDASASAIVRRGRDDRFR